MPHPGLRGGWPAGEPTRRALTPVVRWTARRTTPRTTPGTPRVVRVRHAATRMLARRGGATRPVAELAVPARVAVERIPASGDVFGGSSRRECVGALSHRRTARATSLPTADRGSRSPLSGPDATPARRAPVTEPCVRAGHVRPVPADLRATAPTVPDDGAWAVRDEMNRTATKDVSWPGGDAGAGGEPASPDRGSGAASDTPGTRPGGAGEPCPTGDPAPGSAPRGDGARAGGDAGSRPASGLARRPRTAAVRTGRGGATKEVDHA